MPRLHAWGGVGRTGTSALRNSTGKTCTGGNLSRRATISGISLEPVQARDPRFRFDTPASFLSRQKVGVALVGFGCRLPAAFIVPAEMTDKLPPNLLALFAPRPPLRWVDPPDYAPEKRKTAAIDGVAAFLPQLQHYKETDVYEPTESWLEARDRKKQEKKEAVQQLLTVAPKLCMERWIRT